MLFETGIMGGDRWIGCSVTEKLCKSNVSDFWKGVVVFHGLPPFYIVKGNPTEFFLMKIGRKGGRAKRTQGVKLHDSHLLNDGNDLTSGFISAFNLLVKNVLHIIEF